MICMKAGQLQVCNRIARSLLVKKYCRHQITGFSRKFVRITSPHNPYLLTDIRCLLSGWDVQCNLFGALSLLWREESFPTESPWAPARLPTGPPYQLLSARQTRLCAHYCDQPGSARMSGKPRPGRSPPSGRQTPAHCHFVDSQTRRDRGCKRLRLPPPEARGTCPQQRGQESRLGCARLWECTFLAAPELN